MALVDWGEVPDIVEEDSDGENRRERNDYNIEQAVMDFVDEDPVLHNVYPETDDEDDDIQFSGNTTQRRQGVKRGGGDLYEGQIISSGVAFKEAVLDYALKSGRNIKRHRYDKDKLAYNCAADGCSWRIYCSTTAKDLRWQVKVFKNVHSCAPNGSCEMIKVPVIAQLFVDKIREEPDYYFPLKIEELVMEYWKINVSRSQCQAGRNKALRWIDREYKEQFSRLCDYAREITVSNENSTVEIQCVTNEAGLDIFDRFYVCFDVIRRTWKETCRPILRLDGCHLRSKMKGQLLVVMGRDADNAIYPIAWAVVQAETKDNWLWFVKKIKADLGLNDGDGYIMISDRHRGLISAVALEVPKIEHRKCVRHIYANLKARHGKKPGMKLLIWCLAWSYNLAEYKENLDRIECYDSAVFADVKKTKPESWCRAFYKMGNYCEDVENNSTESWNASIVKARYKPFVPMLETIARLAMVRIAKRGFKADNWKSVCTPYAIDYLAEEYKKASDCKVNISTNCMFDVRVSGCSHRVSLQDRTCSCQRWEITGIPCEHAYAVILSKKLHAENYVCHWFTTAMWKKTYTEGIVPLRGARFWPVGEESRVHEPPEPPQPGRKKGQTFKVSKKDKQRKKGQNESPVKKKLLKRVTHCGICGAANHNCRFHSKKKKQKQGSLGESSQTEHSQGTLTQQLWD